MFGRVHKLCEPGFLGDSEFLEVDRWFPSALGCWVFCVIPSGCSGGSFLSLGQLVFSGVVRFPLGFSLPDPLFAAWVAFVGLCGGERSECSRFLAASSIVVVV